MDTSAFLYVIAGAAALLAALLPRALSRLPVSAPMVFLGLGVLGYALAGEDAPVPDSLTAGGYTEHLTGLTVIVALTGAGLALDRPVSLRGWSGTWRLLGITMPLGILATAVLGWWALGLAPAAAMLLGAVLAPTDPVLAAEVRVGEPADDPEEREDEPRFALTSEAGLNDGLGFPFTYLAIAMATVGVAPGRWFGEWLAYDLLYRVAIGVLAGLAVGWLLAKLFFSAPAAEFRLAEAAEGFVALAATLLAYGAAELIDGYGFVAVFVCALAIRNAERSHGYHRILHSYIEQLERLLTVVVLALLGGAVADGLFEELGWADVLVAVLLLFVVRPVTGMVGLLGKPSSYRERAIISFFGIRGVGSLYYMSYALGHADFPGAQRLFAIVGLVVVLSVVVHGIAATPVMRAFDVRRVVLRRAPTQRPDRIG